MARVVFPTPPFCWAMVRIFPAISTLLFSPVTVRRSGRRSKLCRARLDRAGPARAISALMAVLNPTRAVLEEAARHLRAGGLVAFPTETVYGLGGDATSARAVAAIFDLKGRPKFNPLIIHVASIEVAERLVQMDERARYLAKRCWPGALTMVLPPQTNSPIQPLALGGQRMVAVRMPDHPLALALLNEVGRPLAAPSANRSGSVSPTRAEHVDASFGRSLAMILDGGQCRIGVESTVIDLTREPAALLRPGGVSIETIAASIGELTTGGGTRRAVRCASASSIRSRARCCSLSVPTRPRGSAPCSISARAATWSRPPPICSPICMRSTGRNMPVSPRCRCPSAASDWPSTTGF